MCRAACGIILGVGVFFLLFSALAIAEPSTFNLSSYRPTGYADWMWPVIGGTEWFDQGTTRLNHPFDIVRDYAQKEDQSARVLIFQTNPRYEYQGAERWLLLSSEVYGELYHNNRTSSSVQTRVYSPTDRSIYEFEQKDKYGRRTLDFHGDGETGRYFRGNWLISLQGSLGHSYQAIPDREGGMATYDRVYSPDLTWQRNTQEVKRSDYLRRTTLNLVLSPGYGRVYDGSFAYTAVAIIDEMRKAGKLLREPTYDEMMGLTDVIFKRRQTHPVDGRLHRIESLLAITDYLRTAGITGDLSAAGVVLLTDIWDYFPRAETIGASWSYYSPQDWSFIPWNYGTARQFGWRVRVGAGIEYLRYRSTETVSMTFSQSTDAGPGTTSHQSAKVWQITTDRLPYFTGIAEYHRPINTHWQFYGGLLGRLGFDPASKDSTHINVIYNTDSEVRSTFVTRNLESSQMFGLQASLGYHFDGRTSLTGWISYRAGHDSYSFREMYLVDAIVVDNDGGDRTSDWHVFQLSASAVYRWRVQTSLSLGANYQERGGLDYPQEAYDEYDDHTFQIHMYVSHYLF